jgi:hypothetical protein
MEGSHLSVANHFLPSNQDPPLSSGRQRLAHWPSVALAGSGGGAIGDIASVGEAGATGHLPLCGFDLRDRGDKATPHKGLSVAGSSGAACATAGSILRDSVMMIGSSKGWNESEPAQTGAMRHPQAQRRVAIV